MCTPLRRVRYDGLKLSRRKVIVAQHWNISWFVFFVPEELLEILILETSWHQMFMNRWHQSTEGDRTHKSVSMSHWIHKPHFSRRKILLSTWQHWKEKKNLVFFGFGDSLCAGKHSGAVTGVGLFELGRWYGIRENIEMSFMQIKRCPDLLENPQSLLKTVAFWRPRPSLVYSVFKVGSALLHFHFKAKSVAGGTWWSPDRKEDTKWC